MEKLPKHIGQEAADAVATATGVSAEAVGVTLSNLIPNIIAKPLELDASAGVFSAQMGEIERSLRSASGRVESPGIRLERSRSAQLSSAQVAQLRAAFVRVDANGDGNISKEEIMAALRRDPDLGELLGLHGHTREDMLFEAGRVFQDMDADGNQEIDVDEFVGFFGVSRPEQADEDLLPEQRAQAAALGSRPEAEVHTAEQEPESQGNPPTSVCI